MAGNRLADPYRNYKFKILVPGFEEAQCAFSNIDGLNVEIEVIEYRTGGEVDTVRKSPGMAKYENLVLKRGKSNSKVWIEWVNQVFNLENGFAQTQSLADFRKDLTIVLYDRPGSDSVKTTWNIKYAWPCKVSYESLDGEGNDVLYETIELAYEGFTRVEVG